LDITKDRQYTMQANSLGRRSAQTAAWHILNAMVRWMYPILSFTAEEIWAQLPGEKPAMVLFTEWYKGLFGLEANDSISANEWNYIFTVRELVSKQLEALRVAGGIGASLEAEVDLYYPQTQGSNALVKLGDELRFVLITSEARIHELVDKPADAVEVMENLWVKVSASTAQKCVRCWHHRPEVGSHSEHPELCGRCIENIAGEGEVRLYA
jgi:isoleucyl-tRNA synthetase